MSEMETERPLADVVLEYDLDAAPEQVWRALSVPALREEWLPEGDLADAAAVVEKSDMEICYRMREEEPPFVESFVTFQVRPGEGAGSILRIVHSVADTNTVSRLPPAANSNGPMAMRAA